MTKELDEIIENLNEEPLTLEIYTDDDTCWMYIGSENGSGAEYKIQSIQDIADFVKHYLFTYYTGE